MKFIRLAMPVIALFAIAGQALAADTTVRYLMTVDGITNNPFQVQSFSWGLSNPVTFQNGGISQGHPSVSSLSIMKSFDAVDPGLINACFTGFHPHYATLRGFRGSNTTPFLDIYMEGVFVESHQMSGATNNVLSCSASFAFERITINGVLLDLTTLASNPQRLNDMVASIVQKALATSPSTATKKKISVH